MSANRIGELHEKLTALRNKRNLADDPLWQAVHANIEAGLVNAFTDTGAGDDAQRSEIAASLRMLRALRRVMEGQGENPEQLERELDILEGRRRAPMST